MQYVTGALAILLILIVLVFSIQNLTAVEVKFLVWSMSLPQIILILGTYVLGMFTGWGLVELIKRFWN
jgi:lipopolysaccharide assembly protein A